MVNVPVDALYDLEIVNPPAVALAYPYNPLALALLALVAPTIKLLAVKFVYPDMVVTLNEVPVPR
jgi:hypothetical protein